MLDLDSVVIKLSEVENKNENLEKEFQSIKE